MAVRVDTIPDELKARKQWVCWRLEHGRKVPYNARTGRRAQSDNPATWSTFEQACAAYGNCTHGYAGVGYVFAEDDPFAGVDLDDCIDADGELAAWACDIVATMETYSEISPSGTGVKLWVIGTIPESVKTEHVEIYDHGRYFTVTGNLLPGTSTTIRAVNGELDALYASLRPQSKTEPRPASTAPKSGTAYQQECARRTFAQSILRVTQAPDGDKHFTLYDEARLLGGYIPHGLLTDSEIETALYAAIAGRAKDKQGALKTIRDGIANGKALPIELPAEPQAPDFDANGYALCPTHKQRLVRSANGNGWRCSTPKYGEPLCYWWPGENYSPPAPQKAGEQRDVSPLVETQAASAAPDVRTFLAEAHATDAGNAECMALLYSEQFRYCHTRKTWLYWNGTHWVLDVDGKVQRAILAVVRARQAAALSIEDLERKRKVAAWGFTSESNAKRTAMLQTAAILEPFATTVDLYDRDPMLATVAPGTLDLRTGTLRESRRDDYLTMQLGTAYDPAADCPRWRQFLDEVFAGDQELIGYIQRAIGYSLTGDTSEQKLFLLHGGGANGKSRFLDILSALLGDYAANAAFDTFDAGRRSEASNDLAALKGKRLVTVIETEEDRRLAEAKVKAVTGQDAISCRFLYGEYFSYRPQFKIWLAMNHKPVIRGTDRGIWRRIKLIPFTQNFEGREEPHLEEKLHAELPGILNWALAGLAAWQAHGLGSAAAIEQATEAYRRESDPVRQWLEEFTVPDATSVLSAQDAYESYRDWCKARGEREPTSRALGRRLSELGFKSETYGPKRTMHHFGLRLLLPNEQPESYESYERYLGETPLSKSDSREVTQNNSHNSHNSQGSGGQIEAPKQQAPQSTPHCYSTAKGEDAPGHVASNGHTAAPPPERRVGVPPGSRAAVIAALRANKAAEQVHQTPEVR